MRRRKAQMTPEERLAYRKRNAKRRLIAYGSLFLVLIGVYKFQPNEIDFFGRAQPTPNPPIDPDSARLFSKGTRVLIVTAHPDDSAFYIGGVLTQLGRSGAELHQIICTDGDKGYYWIFTDAEENRRVRRAEALEEIRTWGGRTLTFVGRPDGRLRVDDELVSKIRAKIDEVQAEYVLAFDGDYPPRMSHQDHRRAGDAAELAVKGAPSVKWLMKFSTTAANYYRDISKDWESQRKLLAIHRSQFYGGRLTMIENVVSSFAEDDGEKIDKERAEGFRCIRLK